MNKKYIDINNEVNQLLQKGLKLAMQYEKAGEIDTAEAILKITSQQAWLRMKSSGLTEALQAFWNDKKAMIEKEAI